MWGMLTISVLAVLAIAYDAARDSYCSACYKPFAIWRIRGRAKETRMCRSCAKAYDRRRSWAR